jgi:hypothetical protein
MNPVLDLQRAARRALGPATRSPSPLDVGSEALGAAAPDAELARRALGSVSRALVRLHAQLLYNLALAVRSD